MLKMLRLRFGDLPEEVEGRVAVASLEQLDRWAERLLAAKTLDDVLA